LIPADFKASWQVGENAAGHTMQARNKTDWRFKDNPTRLGTSTRPLRKMNYAKKK
jgi:hypothetical protein